MGSGGSSDVTAETPNDEPARSTGSSGARALALALLLGSTGCDLLGPDRESFTVRVDSISAPASIGQGETLTVGFHGTVGPNGCHRLERVGRTRSPDGLEMRFHGERNASRRVNCTAMVVLLEHEEQVPPPLADPFTIVVRQPGGGTLERVVRVE